MNPTSRPAPAPPNVYLIGCGVVGQAILQAHLAAGCSVSISDLDETRLAAVCNQAAAGSSAVSLASAPPLGEKLPTRHLYVPEQNATHPPPGRVEDSTPLAIESI